MNPDEREQLRVTTTRKPPPTGDLAAAAELLAAEQALLSAGTSQERQKAKVRRDAALAEVLQHPHT